VSGGSGHAGMVLVLANFRLTKADAGRIIAALGAELAEYPGELDLANWETLIRRWLRRPFRVHQVHVGRSGAVTPVQSGFHWFAA
jgi:hypothetical protein